MSHSYHRCEELTPSGRRCTRYAIKTLGDGTRICGEEHVEPVRAPTGFRRNDPCPCGSGIKWKKCCQLRPSSQAGAQSA